MAAERGRNTILYNFGSPTSIYPPSDNHTSVSLSSVLLSAQVLWMKSIRLNNSSYFISLITLIGAWIGAWPKPHQSGSMRPNWGILLKLLRKQNFSCFYETRTRQDLEARVVVAILQTCGPWKWAYMEESHSDQFCVFLNYKTDLYMLQGDLLSSTLYNVCEGLPWWRSA